MYVSEMGLKVNEQCARDNTVKKRSYLPLHVHMCTHLDLFPWCGVHLLLCHLLSYCDNLLHLCFSSWKEIKT